jgi:hypothetical protein
MANDKSLNLVEHELSQQQKLHFNVCVCVLFKKV